MHQGRDFSLDCRIEIKGLQGFIITVALYLLGHGAVDAAVNRCHHVAYYIRFFHVCLELI